MLRKILAPFILSLISAYNLHAQQRMSIYEEFTASNCEPCGRYNPGLENLINSNSGKVLLIAYHYYDIASANASAYDLMGRYTYYHATAMPTGVLNGSGIPTVVTSLTQSAINTDYAAGSPFNLTVLHNWSANGDSVTATVQINTPAAFAPSGANLRLRVAIVERRVFSRSPEGNGETVFPGMVMKMLPDYNGTALSNVWTASQSQTLTLKCKLDPGLPIDKANGTTVVAWIQDDNNKQVLQAAQSAYVPLTTDVEGYEISVPRLLNCSNTTFAPSVTLKNTGSTPLTSARIYYRTETGSWSIYNWTGSLASGVSIKVTLPTIPVTPAPTLTSIPGSYNVLDSVALPNGITDINPGNDMGSTRMWVYQTGSPKSLPYTEHFDKGIPEWVMLDTTAIQAFTKWSVLLGATHNIGYHSSIGVLQFDNGFLRGCSNDVSLAILPSVSLAPGAKVLDFYLACSPSSASSTDTLDLVYSTDCGASWKKIWGGGRGTIATTKLNEPWDFSSAYPSDNDYAFKSIDISGVPDGALLAFRATCENGNPFSIDDLSIHAGTTGVGAPGSTGGFSIYPNPSVSEVSLQLQQPQGGHVKVLVYDALGKLVSTPFSSMLPGGTSHLGFSVATLPAGVYRVSVLTEAGSWTHALTVVCD